jgi:NAD(P)-dependent dehydrogenase (short-subunit alcohol dehydrogenase family)
VAASRSRVDLERVAKDSDLPALSFTIVAADVLGGECLDVLDCLLASPHEAVTFVVAAATIGPVGPLADVDLDAWAESISANVIGTARLLALASRRLSEGDLVVTFSGGGVGGPGIQPNVSSYTTSKAALVHLTEAVARENPEGPVFVAIAPGAFPTGFTDPVLAADPTMAGAQLLDDVARTRSVSFDASDLDRLFDFLEKEPRRQLTGRTLAARWESPDALGSLIEGSPIPEDLYCLRRVDGHAIRSAT